MNKVILSRLTSIMFQIIGMLLFLLGLPVISSADWTIEAVDTEGSVGEYTDIAIDSNNKVHISYFDWTNGDLKYATNESGSWVTSTIDSAGTVGRSPSIAIDSKNM